MIRAGLIGAGFIGRNHFNQYEKLTDRVKLLAICDKEADRRAGDWTKVGGNLADAQGTRRDLGEIRCYADWKVMIAQPDIDLVDICAPTHLHPEIAVAALKAGKHVLCEKPMALTVDACDEMIRAAEASPGRLMIGQCVRFWPEYVYLKQLHDAGTLGPLKALHLRRHAGTPFHSLNHWMVDPALSGGAVVDLHVHDIDFAMYLLGKPTSVFATGYPRGRTRAMDRVHTLWRYEGSEWCVAIEGLWDLPSGYPFNMGFTAVFEEAAVVWDMSTGNPMRVYRSGQDPETPEITGEDAYLAEITHFIDAIERGENPTVTTPGESRDAVAIALAEKESALTGQPVRIG